MDCPEIPVPSSPESEKDVSYGLQVNEAHTKVCGSLSFVPAGGGVPAGQSSWLKRRVGISFSSGWALSRTSTSMSQRSGS